VNIAELEGRFAVTSQKLGVSATHQAELLALLKPLKDGPEPVRTHYAHSLRVGHKAHEIARVTHHEPKPLLIAGTVHDVGKCEISADVLGKTANWTEADALVMQEHVMAGYEILKSHFEFSAEIILWHHRFQKNGYPEVLPPPLHGYSEATKVLIVEYGRILALADVYDALHRQNDKFDGDVDGQRIKELMFQFNPDCIRLVDQLYQTGIFAV